MLPGYENPFTPDMGVYEVHIDLEVVNDPATVEHLISEARRCFGDEVIIITHIGGDFRNEITPPSD